MGVKLMVFDNLDELGKIKSCCPEARLLLRIFAKDETALLGLEDKYGAPLKQTKPLLERARELGLGCCWC